ncbi:hypothetical protein X801_08084, partial [Opisthorchis viverrini]
MDRPTGLPSRWRDASVGGFTMRIRLINKVVLDPTNCRNGIVTQTDWDRYGITESLTLAGPNDIPGGNANFDSIICNTLESTYTS